MRSILAAVALAAALGSLHAAAPPQAQAQGPAVRSEMLVTSEWLAARLDDPAVVVVHVARERAHYDAGHIPGARLVLWGELTATRDGVPNELPPVDVLKALFERLGVGERGRIVLYGDTFGLSAARAYFTLDYLGHGDRAALLDGGLEAWSGGGRTVSKEPVATKPAPFTPRVRHTAVVGLDVVRDLAWTASELPTSNVVLVDARPAEEYSGATPGEGVARGGHIPGAANVFWMQNLVSKENPVLRPVAELRALYERAGARDGQTVVTYCRTGGQAAHAYFTAKYLGYPVVMYDGSFFEWSRADGTPVESGSGGPRRSAAAPQ